MRVLLLFILPVFLLIPYHALSQTQYSSDAEFQSRAVRLYLDVPFFLKDYVKKEITFVNYVRDPHDAQVHVLVTQERTGSGGDMYTISLIGRQNFAGVNDTLKCSIKPLEPEEVARAEIVKTLKLGLMRYVEKTPQAEFINIMYSRKVKPTEVIDRWDRWVFGLSANGYYSEEKSTRNYSLSAGFSADRVTEELKLSFYLSRYYNESRFDVGDLNLTSISRSFSFRGLAVKSLGEHWSSGARFGAYSSTYSNIESSCYFAPAVEFDFFPYSQSTRKELRVLYEVRVSREKYEEDTIYGKLEETLYSEGLSMTLSVKERWGSVMSSVGGSHYFHDFKKNRLTLSSTMMLRLIEGLSLTLTANVSRIHDQLSLPKGGATTEEILLRRKELETGYFYYFSVGFNYRFGSIYSNVVNPRFGN